MDREVDMATKKSGFNAPAIGVKHPKNSAIKKNANGTISIVSSRSRSRKGKN